MFTGSDAHRDLLIFADLAEVGDADSEIGKGAMSDDGGKVISIEMLDHLEGGADDSFWSRSASLRFEEGERTRQDLGSSREDAEHRPPA